MMHVAEAGEEKGRVVLPLCSSAANPVAVEAALWLARAFQSEIEGIFIENEQLLELASFPLARALSFAGKLTAAPSNQEIERHFRFVSAAFHDEIEARARAAEIPFKQRIVRGEPVAAIAIACAQSGPWNVVAIAEPFTSPECPPLRELVERVSDATGLLLVGPAAQRTTGPIVLVLERVEALPTMLAVAERLVRVQDGPVSIFLVAESDAQLPELEQMARLVLAERTADPAGHGPRAELVPTVVGPGSSAAVAESVRRLRPGLVIGQFGGLLIPDSGDLRPLATALECPLLLIR